MGVELLLGAMLGLGVWLVVTSLPWVRPRLTLAERMTLLTARGWLEHQQATAKPAPLFKSPALERLLRPVIEDSGALVARLMRRAGLSSADLDQRLALGWAGMDVPHFYGQKLTSGLVLFAVFPLFNAVALSPLGPWPVWVWLLGFAAGFALPDWLLEARLERRRRSILVELPALLDVLSIAASGGMSPEQALHESSRKVRGTLGDCIRAIAREAGLGAATYAEGLKAMAGRERVPEIVSLADAWQSAQEQGLPLGSSMLTLAETVRERKRARLIEEGGKTSVRMLIPVAVFIFPVFLIVLIYPAGVELLGLGA